MNSGLVDFSWGTEQRQLVEKVDRGAPSGPDVALDGSKGSKAKAGSWTTLSGP